MQIQRKNNSFEVNGFVINKKYNYNEFSRNDEETGRTYNVGEHKVPSVTTILSKTQNEEKRKSLDAWRERVGYQEAARITNQAARRGTEMHYVLEQYLQGIGYLNLSKEGALPRMMAHTIVDNLDNFSQVYGTEVSLSYKDQWAGSSDLIGVYDDKPTIIDFKQANKPKREEWIEDYYYQIAAYALAHKLNFGPITQGLICVCTKDLVYQQFKMNEDNIKEYEDKWFARVEKFYKYSKTSSPKV
jgi:genome maintenance exonuclease 1|tara:strand:- start:106 stop:837 length:732 start_codon:yes stop_codon:yes gene_type:complete